MPERPTGRAVDLIRPRPSALERHRYTLVALCFFLSGATGLVYEVVWSRRLTLTFGATVLAVSTVLAAFLGGLALGSLIFGRVVDRRKDPVRIYAILEALVGLYCFATPLLFNWVEQAYVVLHPSVAGVVWQERMLRFGLAVAVLIVPTILMGGTLPALTRAFVSDAGGIGNRVAKLYGINTLGATLGAGVAGFALLPLLGLRGTVYAAAIVNLLIAALALAVHQSWPSGPRAVTKVTKAELLPSRPRHPSGSLGFLLLAYAFSGAAALIYEVAWSRVLCLSFGTSTYAFTAILVSFLLGIALGSLSFATRFVGKLRDPLLAFGILQVLLAVAVTALSPALDNLPAVAAWTHGRLEAADTWAGLAWARDGWMAMTGEPLVLAKSLAAFQTCLLLETVIVLLAPTFVMGVTFPLVTRIATERVGVLGRRLGAVYAANTIGTVVGSFCAGFLLIPWIGAQYCLAVGVALNALVGLGYVLLRKRRSLGASVFALVATVAIVGAWGLLPQWNRSALSSGSYLYSAFVGGDTMMEALWGRDVLYYKDGITCTVSVSRSNPGTPDEVISLQTNGKADASNIDMSTQLLSAHLPMLLHGDPESMLIVGLASGCTVGAALQHEEVRSVDCVEIEPAMPEAARFFAKWNHNCLDDPRLKLHFDDARSYVLVNQRKYDVITAEPSNPWIAGVGNLFSFQHWQRLRNQLAPGGVLCQWVGLYNLGPAELSCMLETFTQVFPDATMWVFAGIPTDAFLVGTNGGPVDVDVEQIARQLRKPVVAEDMRLAYVKDLWDFLGGQLYPARERLAGLPRTRLNNDEFPVIEFGAPFRLYDQTWDQPSRETLDRADGNAPPLPRPKLGPDGACEILGLELPGATDLTQSARYSRDSDLYRGHDYEQTGVPVVVTVRGEMRGCPLTVYAWRTGQTPDDPRCAAPEGEPLGAVDIDGHEARVWRVAGGLVAMWECPEAGKAFRVFIGAGVAKTGLASDPWRVLDSIGCVEGG